ncbi:unnamed protein product [Blepharisma stoltei]|uniref:UBC core domain-containing protein n=1 Tax=Blepharisma stoltei TaxID=1481888 RepID=A0AAU9IVC9_9CILI|nr:unnamed protein product [Blepharisma stoltei]
MSIKRIKNELLDLKRNPQITRTAWQTNESDSDWYNITAVITGPENSPYQGGLFFLQLKFPTDYPFKPPKVQFYTKIYTHPLANVGICVVPWKGNYILVLLLLLSHI